MGWFNHQPAQCFGSPLSLKLGFPSDFWSRQTSTISPAQIHQENVIFGQVTSFVCCPQQLVGSSGPNVVQFFLEICWLFLGMNRWKNLNFKCLKFQFSFYHGKSKSNYPNATPDHGAQPSLNKALFVGVNVALGGVNVPYVPGKYP